MTGIDPVTVAVELLRAELPAFDTYIVGYNESVALRGALPIGADVSTEMIRHMMPRRPEFFGERAPIPIRENDVERARRLAKERREIVEMVAPVVRRIAEEIRHLAIEAVNLRPTIARQVLEAERRGEAAGRRIGYAQGKSEGRREMLAEVMAAREEDDEDV